MQNAKKNYFKSGCLMDRTCMQLIVRLKCNTMLSRSRAVRCARAKEWELSEVGQCIRAFQCTVSHIEQIRII